jgi:hypothetical protein
MVINHLEKLFVTSDASTIVTEMDVYHPAAKLLVMAAKAQAGEVGDGTNLVSHHGLPYCLDRPAAWQQQGGRGGAGATLPSCCCSRASGQRRVRMCVCLRCWSPGHRQQLCALGGVPSWLLCKTSNKGTPHNGQVPCCTRRSNTDNSSQTDRQEPCELHLQQTQLATVLQVPCLCALWPTGCLFLPILPSKQKLQGSAMPMVPCHALVRDCHVAAAKQTTAFLVALATGHPGTV